MTLDVEARQDVDSRSGPRAVFSAGNVQDKEAYFLAAYAVLGCGGHSALTIAALCERLGVTKGSFYHHFSDMPSFVSAFARRWQGWVTALLEAYEAEPDLRRRLELMFNSHLAAVNGAEPAIRAWTWTNPALAAATEQVERVGDRVAARTFGQILDDPAAGEVLGVLGTLLMCGLQQRTGQVEPPRFARMGAEFVSRFLGLHAEVVWAEFGPALQVRSRIARRPAAGWDGFVSPWLADANPDAESRPGPRTAGTTPAGPVRGGGRLGAADFVAAARRILAEVGCDGITMAALCEELAVTKGSFTHHFTGMDEFVERMAADWATTNLAWLNRCQARPDPPARLVLLHGPMLAEADRGENAWHAWAWTNPTVAGTVADFEHHWQDLLTHTLQELGHDPATASALAEMDIGLTLGIRQRRPPLNADGRRVIAGEWLRKGLGLDIDLHGPSQPQEF